MTFRSGTGLNAIVGNFPCPLYVGVHGFGRRVPGVSLSFTPG